MNVILERKQLDDLQLHARLYTYLLSTLTKTYFCIGDNKFTMSLVGTKGMCNTTFEVDFPHPPVYFQCEYSKFSNALSKVGFSPTASLRITNKTIKVSFEGNSDTINLAIISYDKDSSEADMMKTYLQEAKQEVQDGGIEIDFTDEVRSSVEVAASMFTTVGNNNAVAFKPDHILYSDRSVVLKSYFTPPLDIDQALVHKYALGIILLTHKTNSKTWFNKNFTKLYWEDDLVSLVIAMDACDIAVPTDDEFKSIIPDNGYELTIDQHDLFQGLQFFTGFYEASVWKPITFNILNDGTAHLYYKHPSTEAKKDLNVIGSGKGSFIVASETLLKLLAKSIERSDDAETISIYYDDNSPGIHCLIGGQQNNPRYEVVLGKLVE